jgi:translocator protein
MSLGRSLLGMAGWIVLSQAAGLVGMLLSGRRVPEYYQSLHKPTWSPPGWIFGPVWGILFTMMGIAAWRVWEHHNQPGAFVALGLFAVQLILNSAWSGIFFGLRKPRAAVYELGALWVAIAATTLWFWRIEPLGGLLLLPYLGWTAFAGLLNARIVQMNPSRPDGASPTESGEGGG